MSHRVLRSLGALVGLALVGRSLVLAQSSSLKTLSQVHGIVLDESTHAPVPYCHLSMRLERQQNARRGLAPDNDLRTTETDVQGRFSLDLPGEGTWQLSASAAGYRTQSYNEHEGFSSAVVLRSGLAVPSLVFQLEPDSAISGFVLDEAAEPVRNAALTLQVANPSGGIPGRPQRGTTDDRGHFEISGVAPGSYKLSVQATPWYTTGNAARLGSFDPAQPRAGDPVFDVVYPVTWYPGVLDSEAAGEINLHAGQMLKIDFHLLPVPAAHLHVSAPVARLALPLPVSTIERVEDGQAGGMSSSISNTAGQVDFGSLSPGFYRVNTPQPDGQSTTTFVRVSAGATVSLAAADPAGTANVTFQIVGDDRLGRTQINLNDPSSRSVFTSFSDGGFGLRRRQSPSADPSEGSAPTERHIAVPVGRYQVTLAGDPDLYLTSMTLKGKALEGRMITLPGGPVTLTLNVARGRAKVTGHTLLAGKPVDGAMVMLVPTTFGQAGAMDLLRRDQSDTDGSFSLLEVIPGDYILFAIDHGWTVNWHDPATLNRYLLHGTPLSLQSRSNVEQQITAQSP